MKLFIIKPNEFGISKYLVYLIIIFFLCRPFVKKIGYSFTYTHTTGIVKYFRVYEYYTSRGRRTTSYPVVEFAVNSDTFYCMGSSFQKDVLNTDTRVAVIYDPTNPKHGYLYSFLGYWGLDLPYLIPGVLIVSLAVLGLDSVPKFLRMKFEPRAGGKEL